MTEIQKCTEPLRKISDAKDLTEYSDYADDEEHREHHEHHENHEHQGENRDVQVKQEDACVLLRNSLKCIDQFTERCLPPKQKYAVDMLFEEVREIVQHKCPDDVDMEKREQHHEHMRCMAKHHHEYQECVALYKNHTSELRALEQHYSDGHHDQHDQHHHHHHMDSSKIITSVCCGFLKYVDCSVKLFREKCGERVGQFSEDYLTKTAGSIISARCSSYRHDSEECQLSAQKAFTDAVSSPEVSSSTSAVASWSLVVAAIFIVHIKKINF
jgi:hypothetical protein